MYSLFFFFSPLSSSPTTRRFALPSSPISLPLSSSPSSFSFLRETRPYFVTLFSFWNSSVTRVATRRQQRRARRRRRRRFSFPDLFPQPPSLYGVNGRATPIRVLFLQQICLGKYIRARVCCTLSFGCDRKYEENRHNVIAAVHSNGFKTRRGCDSGECGNWRLRVLFSFFHSFFSLSRGSIPFFDDSKKEKKKRSEKNALIATGQENTIRTDDILLNFISLRSSDDTLSLPSFAALLFFLPHSIFSPVASAGNET